MKVAPCLFNHLNQADPSKNHRMACTVYSSVINLYYNTGIKLEQSDVDFLVDDWVKKWILSLEKWWSLEDNFMNVFSYAKKKHPELQYEIFYKENAKFAKYLEAGYMLRIGIGVNAEYTYDSQDNWAIDTEDYSKLKGDTKHATNSLKWKKESSDLNKHFIFDSYFWRKEFNLYQVNLRNMKDTIMMNNAYLFYI